MKIAYLGQMADMANENGISKKIRHQATSWMKAGHEVGYFALTPSGQTWKGLAPLQTTLLRRGMPLQRRAASLRLCQLIREWKPDVVYFRYAYHDAGLPALFHDIPCVAEINSDDASEYALTLPLHKRIYHRLTRRRILKSVSAIIPVTREIGTRLDWLRVPSLVLANSMSLEGVETLPPPNTATPSLFFIGNTGTPWHGLERIGELAELLPQMRVDVVGCTEQDWKSCSATPAPRNMHFHGMLPKSAYGPLVEKATAAIGTMALYKKAMNEACPLKVREYLALGLPVIAAYEDTDIPPDADYFLRLPNDASPIAKALPQITAFIHHWQGRRVPRTAIAHMDAREKETRRLAFLQEICARHARRATK